MINILYRKNTNTNYLIKWFKKNNITSLIANPEKTDVFIYYQLLSSYLLINAINNMLQ